MLTNSMPVREHAMGIQECTGPGNRSLPIEVLMAISHALAALKLTRFSGLRIASAAWDPRRVLSNMSQIKTWVSSSRFKALPTVLLGKHYPILFIDYMHTILGAGSAQFTTVDASNLL